MIRHGFFLAVVIIGILATGVSAQENKFRYTFPGNLTYEIVPEGKVWKGESMKAMMNLVGNIGTLKDLRVSFFSSPDLKVTPGDAILEQLAAGKAQSFQVQVSPSGTASKVGTWIGLTVDYLPDYGALEKILSQKDKYPLEGPRNDILRILATNKQKNSRPKDGTRFFFEAPK